MDKMDDVLLGGNDYFCKEQNYNTIHKKLKRMKKHILVALCALFSMGTLAQTGEKAVGLNVSYGTEIKNIGIGVKGQYNFTDVIRGEASFDYFLKKDGLSMWDVNLNAHYLFPLGDKLKVYPLAGLSFTNWKADLILEWDDDIKDLIGEDLEDEDLGTWSESKFGVNLGGGIQYDLTDKLIFSAEAKYQLISDFDQAVFSVGVAYKF